MTTIMMEDTFTEGLEINTSAENICNSAKYIDKLNAKRDLLNLCWMNLSRHGGIPRRLDSGQRAFLQNPELLESGLHLRNFGAPILYLEPIQEYSITMFIYESIMDQCIAIKNMNFIFENQGDESVWAGFQLPNIPSGHGVLHECQVNWLRNSNAVITSGLARDETKNKSFSLGLRNEKIVKAKLIYVGKIEPGKFIGGEADYTGLESL